MAQLTLASLNTRGTPFLSSNLTKRCTAIGAVFEASSVDVVNLQEVHTYYHLAALRRATPSYAFAAYRPSIAGPAGGLLTLSRTQLTNTTYRSLGAPAPWKGLLTTRLSGVTIANTHLLANRDGDWSDSNRFHHLQQTQVTALGRHLTSLEGPAILSGDFNISRDSSLYRHLLQTTGLADAFGDSCPPTFHLSYLAAGKTAHCIDFVLHSRSTVTVQSARLTFTSGRLSDHLGLEACFTLPR